MKDTYYFSHDYNARNDHKIKKLISRHGYLGYGLFWALIEDLYNNANALQTDCETIAFDLRTSKDTIESILNDFDLFVFEGEAFGSLSVQKRLEERNAKSAKARESAFKRWNSNRPDANALQTHSECNAIKESKGKKNKENNIIDNTEIPTFENVLIYISSYLQENNKQITDRLKMSVKAKFDSWIENDWKDGNNKKIINWKTKFKNSLDYMPAYKELFDSIKIIKSTKQIEIEEQIKKNIISISKGMYEIRDLKEYCRQHWKYGIEELKKIDNFPIEALPE